MKHNFYKSNKAFHDISSAWNLNHNYNFGVYAFICIMCSIIYYSSLNNLYFSLASFISVSYLILYTWRTLELSILSYVCFMINSLLFFLFSFGIYRLLFVGFSNPILLQDLSLFSYYRYMGFLILACLGICLFILLRFYPSLSPFITTISFPYLKEETRLILSSWDDGFIGDICSKMLNKIVEFRRYQLFLLITHFMIFHLFGCIQTLLFFNFVFFTGDLRWNIYLLPISFCIWLLRFLEYYFIIFFTNSLQYLSDILKVETKEGLFILSNNFIIAKPKDLIYTITPYGISKGFTDGAIVFGEWLKYVQLHSFLLQYKNRVAFLSMSFVILNVICWSYLVSILNTPEQTTLVWPFILYNKYINNDDYLLI